MIRKILLSLLIGLVLTFLSLLVKGGTNVVPMPPTGVLGLCVIDHPNCFSKEIGYRGFPFAITGLRADEDEPQNFYQGFNVLGTIADLVIYSSIVFLCLQMFPKARKI